MSSKALEALDDILDRGGEPDDVLREATRALAGSSGIAWAGIAFLDDGRLARGPSAGEPDSSRRVSVPIVFQGSPVGELWVDGDAERVLLEKIADCISGHVLIGWDTRGESWEP